MDAKTRSTGTFAPTSQWFGQAIASCPMPAFVKDASGKFVAANQCFLNLRQLDSEDQLVGRDDTTLTGEQRDFSMRYHKIDTALVAQDNCHLGILEHNNHNAETTLVDKIPFVGEDGQRYLFGMLRPLDAHSRKHVDLGDIHTRYEIIAEITNGGYFELRENQQPYLSRKLRSMLAIDPARPQVALRTALHHLTPASVGALRQAAAQLRSTAPTLSLDVETRDGKTLELRGKALFKQGGVERIVGTAIDATRERNNARILKEQAQTDFLTGLPNRRAMDNMFQRFLGRARQRPFVLAFVDLDEFRNFNQEHGLVSTDTMLNTVAARLRDTATGEAKVARIGVDKFALMFEAGSEEEIVVRLEQFRHAVEQPLLLDASKRVVPKVSIGAVHIADMNTPLETLLRQAEIAMQESRTKTDQLSTLYQPSMMHDRLERQRMQEALHPAIINREFNFWYQPILEMENSHQIGVEALMRWHSPEFGLVGADRFVPLLEQDDLITELTGVLLDQLALDLKGWNHNGILPDFASFNLSPLQLAHPQLLEHCERFFRAVKDLPVQIIFEITESAVIEDLGYAQRILCQLREMGACIALDDFGVGFSSLAVLHQLPIELLKLDGLFTESLFDSERAEQVIRSILQLARTLSVPAVAERVETNAEADWLREAGCAYLQGYLFSPPMAPDKIGDYILTTRMQSVHRLAS